ncbi:MAG: Hpt domain-containing protein [Rhodobiaceae bacterium]|nr:Hpt domain-containing protein [Rhodobiaceae bacterium]MCC0012298.1 Hpt domain-containing protein [Rhodobiaceae bacterium]MCC0060787.1 Hpt domain-containing protein [Rhodobiaceae bacterium]
MSDEQKNEPEEELEVVHPPKNLKHLVFQASGGGSSQIDLEAIERAEHAMEKLSVSFNMWMEDEIDTLRKAHDGTKKGDMAGESRQALFRAAHDIRGEAGTLGFPLVGQAAGSLADLLCMLPEDASIPEALIDGHVQAICAMLRENASGDDNKTAVDLVNCLREAATRLLEAEGALDDQETEEPEESNAA